MKVMSSVAIVALLAATPVLADRDDAHLRIHLGVPGVHVGVGLGVPAPIVVTDPCVNAYETSYPYCNYPVWSEPVIVNGVEYNGPIHYRMFDGRREYFVRGGWRTGTVRLHEVEPRDRDDRDNRR